MQGLSLPGLMLGALSGGTPTPTPSYTGALTLTAIPAIDEYKNYQRASFSGGGQGKGQGPIALPITGATAGTIGVRVVDATTPTTVLQVCADKTITNGQTTLTISDVDARYGWFFVELKDSSGTWQRMTYRCGMGAVIHVTGQSLGARLFGRHDGDTMTYGAGNPLNLSPDPCLSVLATWNEPTSYPNPYVAGASALPYQLPTNFTDGNGPNSLGVAAIGNDMIAMLGVNVTITGHTHGGMAIKNFITGQADATQNAAIITRAGGAFEALAWVQGHGDSTYGATPKWYKISLDLIKAQFQALSSVSGIKMVACTIPAIGSNSWGQPWRYNQVRAAGDLWEASGGGYVAHAYDIDQSDGVHNWKTGNARLGWALTRAFRLHYGLSSGKGPTIVSATRVGAVITATLSNEGQSSINFVGTPGNRIWVQTPGAHALIAGPNNNRYPVSSVTSPNATTLTITLSSDPGDQAVLDLWGYYPCGPLLATTDNIYDDVTLNQTYGRILCANTTAVSVAAANPAGTPVVAPGTVVAQASPYSLNAGSPAAVYGTSDRVALGFAAFNQALTDGQPTKGNNSLPTIASGFTWEGEFTTPGTFGSAFAIWCDGVLFMQVNGSGFLNFNNTSSPAVTSSQVCLVNTRYRWALSRGPTGTAMYLKDITNNVDYGRVYSSGSAIALACVSGSVSGPGLRHFVGTRVMVGGQVEEQAVWDSDTVYSGASWTPRNTPFTGKETGLILIYPCDNSVADLVAW